MKLQKKLTKKVKSIMNSDILVSVAMVSLCANIFFLAAVGVYASTSRLDKSAYSVAYQNMCVDNYNKNARSAQKNSTNPELALLYFEITCNSGDFSLYHEDAVEKYLDDKY